MKSYKIIALGLAALVSASCADKVCIRGILKDAPARKLEIRQLDLNKFTVLDSVETGSDGAFSYSIEVKEGQPEFIYVFYGSTKVASLLLEKGEKVFVEADTSGNYSVSGSEGSSKLRDVEMRYADFISRFIASDGDNAAMTKLYVDYYRSCVKYVLGNPYSITVIPVLYQDLSEYTPVFNRYTDAIFFRSAADSLKTVYPESRYVKALEKEAARRQQELFLSNSIQNAEVSGFPNISLPNEKGEKVSLSSLDAKCIMIHFWDSSDNTHSMFNNDVLLPVYNEFHSKGFEIYSVCLDVNKAQWASVVKSQNLPWINVNDGQGAYSPAVSLYGVDTIPAAFLIADGDLVLEPIEGITGLRKELAKRLH